MKWKQMFLFHMQIKYLYIWIFITSSAEKVILSLILLFLQSSEIRLSDIRHTERLLVYTK